MPSITSFNIILTRKCNLSCLYCLRQADGIQKEELAFATIKKIIQKTEALGAKKSCSLTGGEPTLHSEFFKILEFLLLKNFSIWLETNGMNFEKIIKHPLFNLTDPARISFLVSLDSYKKETHDSFRGEGSFEKAIRMIEILRERRNAFSVNAVVNKLNNPSTVELDDFALFLIKRGVKDCIFSPIVSLGRNKDNRYSLTINEAINFSTRLNKANEKYKHLIKLPPVFNVRSKNYCSKIENKNNGSLTFSPRGFHSCLYQEECIVSDFKEAFDTDFAFVDSLGHLRRSALAGDEYINGDCWSCASAFSDFFSKHFFSTNNGQ